MSLISVDVVLHTVRAGTGACPYTTLAHDGGAYFPLPRAERVGLREVKGEPKPGKGPWVRGSRRAGKLDFYR